MPKTKKIKAKVITGMMEPLCFEQDLEKFWVIEYLEKDGSEPSDHPELFRPELETKLNAFFKENPNIEILNINQHIDYSEDYCTAPH